MSLIDATVRDELAAKRAGSRARKQLSRENNLKRREG
jgi:hypothetical protein